MTDWLINKSTSALDGKTTTTLNASSLEGDFIITCTSDGKFSYAFKTVYATANGAIKMRVGAYPIISETWLESYNSGYRVLSPATPDISLLQKLYKNWDFVVQYNSYTRGVQTAENGSAGFSNAIDKTRADCKWSNDLFPSQNGWGMALPTVPPDDALEATDLSGLDVSRRVRLIAWKAPNAAGNPQLLVRMGDVANTNAPMGTSDSSLYVTQDGKMVAAVSGFSFVNPAYKPVIVALNGDFDASRPLTLTMMAYHFHMTDKLVPVAEVKFSR